MPDAGQVSIASAKDPASQNYIRLEKQNGGGALVRCAGDWTAANAAELEHQVSAALPELGEAGSRHIDIEQVSRLDTIGAWLLMRLGGENSKGAIQGGSEQHNRLLDRIAESNLNDGRRRRYRMSLLTPFIALGRVVIDGAEDAIEANAIQGRILMAFGRTWTFRAPLRFASLVTQFEQVMLLAAPIVGLIALVVGAIITQQSILQLRMYGATIFVVDLSAILMFREIGVLLAAIMVAGRSGSAITAEIGSMRMREELDAMQVMGVDPHQALLLPRLTALVIGMPLLAFLGSIAGLVGAAVVAKFYGDISFSVFIDRLRGAITIQSFLIGLIKAPFMGFLIGLIASIEGMRVEGSSESLGRHTTAAVVKSIFVVIVADGLFAMFFAAMGI